MDAFLPHFLVLIHANDMWSRAVATSQQARRNWIHSFTTIVIAPLDSHVAKEERDTNHQVSTWLLYIKFIDSNLHNRVFLVCITTCQSVMFLSLLPCWTSPKCFLSMTRDRNTMIMVVVVICVELPLRQSILLMRMYVHGYLYLASILAKK